MRSLCVGLAGTILAGWLVFLAPGCDSGGGSGLEQVPTQAKPVDPAKDMPAYDPAQDKSKAAKK